MTLTSKVSCAHCSVPVFNQAHINSSEGFLSITEHFCSPFCKKDFNRERDRKRREEMSIVLFQIEEQLSLCNKGYRFSVSLADKSNTIIVEAFIEEECVGKAEYTYNKFKHYGRVINLVSQIEEDLQLKIRNKDSADKKQPQEEEVEETNDKEVLMKVEGLENDKWVCHISSNFERTRAAAVADTMGEAAELAEKEYAFKKSLIQHMQAVLSWDVEESHKCMDDILLDSTLEEPERVYMGNISMLAVLSFHEDISVSRRAGMLLVSIEAELSIVPKHL